MFSQGWFAVYNKGGIEQYWQDAWFSTDQILLSTETVSPPSLAKSVFISITQTKYSTHCCHKLVYHQSSTKIWLYNIVLVLN